MVTINFDEYHKFLVKKNKYDPFKEHLPDDSYLWRILLKYLYKDNKKLYEIFHGLRCLGFQLEYNKKLKLISNIKYITKSRWLKIKQEYLNCHVKEIKETFNVIEDKLETGNITLSELL